MGEERNGREKTAVLICGDDGYIGYALKAHLRDEVRELLRKIEPYKDNVIKEAIQPRTAWK